MRTAFLLGLAFVVACTTPGQSSDAGPDVVSANDSGPKDSASETSVDASDASDASDAGTTYNDITNTANWTTVDLTTKDPKAVAYNGGTFDGKYIYFAPNNTPYSTLIARYDTTAPFTAASWTLFDATQIGLGGYAFAGAAFDGKHVYFIPRASGSTYEGYAAQYDTTGAFTTNGSWNKYDIYNGSHAGSNGAVFDSKYLYFAAFYNSDLAAYDGLFVAYDTTSSLTTTGSYIPFDPSANGVGGGVKGFDGAVFDGQYIYFAPTLNGLATRYDTKLPFGSAGSWSTFDMAVNINATADGFTGAGFDGKYVYFVPNGHNLNGSSGLVPRFDTTKSFSSSGSWDSFDATTITNGTNAKGFAYCAFDGRYMYFIPCNAGGAPGSLLARYDTEGSFTSTSAWSLFDTTKVAASAKAFSGAVFDGRYVYLIPNGNAGGGTANGLVLRFDAKTPSSMPKGYSGSFF